MKCFQVKFVLGVFLLIQTGHTQSETGELKFSASHYDVTIRLITDDKTLAGKPFTAPGKITIDGVSHNKTNELKLTVGKQMEINPNSVIIKSMDNSTNFTVRNVTRNDTSLLLHITPEIKAGQKLSIYLEFVTPIEQSCGKWGGPDGYICYSNTTTDKALFSTIEPFKMFPCFYEQFHDEKDKRKSTLRLKLIRPNELNSTIGSTRVETSVPDLDYPGWTVDTLKKTKIIALVEFVFASTNYGYLEKSFGNEKSFRLYAPNEDFSNNKNKLEKVAKDCVGILNYLEEYFNQSQRVPKFDAVLHPVRMAMLTWGINIVPTEDPSTYYPVDADLFNIFVQVIPFQWVENYIPTNEEEVAGAVNYLVQTTQIAIDNKNGKFEQVKARNVFLRLRAPYINLFGIWNVLETYLSPATVKKGLLNFVNQGFSSKQKLVSTLQAAADDNGHNLGNLTVETIVDMWREQDGYPILRVGSMPNGKINVSLQAVQPDKGPNAEVNSNSNWTVPLKFKQNLTKTDESLILIDTQEKTKIVNANLHDWIKSGGRGFYRTLFDDNATQWIQQQLESDSNSFDTVSRAYLLQDYNKFVKEGFVSYSTILNLMKYINNETQAIVYNEFIFVMKDLNEKFLFSPEYAVIKNFTSKKLKDLWKSAVAADYPKTDLYNFACNLGESFCYPWAEKHIMTHWTNRVVS